MVRLERCALVGSCRSLVCVGRAISLMRLVHFGDFLRVYNESGDVWDLSW
jgi:hypothetical protein